MKEKKKTKAQLAKLKKTDRDRRKFDIRVRTQLDNAIYSFMYAVESLEIEVDKKAEDYITYLLFAEETIEKSTKLIRKKKASFEDLIDFTREVAKKAVELATNGKEEKPEKIELEHVKQAIKEVPASENWFEDVENS